MDYSTESIAQLAQQMTAAFKAAVAHHLEGGGQALTIADVETGMREFLRQIGTSGCGQPSLWAILAVTMSSRSEGPRCMRRSFVHRSCGWPLN